MYKPVLAGTGLEVPLQPPEQFEYKTEKPMGYPHTMKKISYTPDQELRFLQTNSTITFSLENKPALDGFINPHNTRLEFFISADQLPDYGILSLDQGAHSLISRIKLFNNDREFEDIQDVDTIVTILNDMHYDAQERKLKPFEGLSSINIPDFTAAHCQIANPQKQLNNEAFCVKDNYNSFKLLNENDFYNEYQTQQTYCPNDLSHIRPRSTNFSQGVYIDKDNLGNSEHSGFATNTALAQVFSNPKNNIINIPDKALLAPHDWYQLGLNVNSYSNRCALFCGAKTSVNKDKFSQNIGGRYEFQWNNEMTQSYEPAEDVESKESNDFRRIYNGYTQFDVKNTEIEPFSNYSGYLKPYINTFAQGGFEQCFVGDSIPNRRILYGKPALEMGRKILHFSIPLYSAVFGILMPSQNFKYIPMSLFKKLKIQIELNPYAFYTSGYKQTSQNDVLQEIKGGVKLLENTSREQILRSWKFDKIELQFDYVQFNEQLTSMIQSQLTDGFTLQTQSWSRAYREPFLKTSLEVQKSWQLDVRAESLRFMAITFQPLDFEKYSFCKKSFRLSVNLKKLQLYLGFTKFPEDPLYGHGGIPFGFGHPDGDNKAFFEELLKTFGRLYNLSSTGIINPFNFAVNDRAYNPEKLGSVYSVYQLKPVGNMECKNGTTLPVDFNVKAQTLTTPECNYTYQPTNGHTSGGLPYFHENRVQGKAVYFLNTSARFASKGFLGGLNILAEPNFGVNIEVDQQQPGFQRALMMNIYYYYDAIFKFDGSGTPSTMGLV